MCLSHVIVTDMFRSGYLQDYMKSKQTVKMDQRTTRTATKCVSNFLHSHSLLTTKIW